MRQRAHCLILASQGVRVKELVRICQVSRKTIYNWFERWESKGVVGLYNKSGRGRKPILNSQQKAQLKNWLKEEPRQLKKVLEQMESEWGIQTSKKILARILKRLRMSEHSMDKAAERQSRG